VPDFSPIFHLIPEVEKLMGPDPKPGSELAVITTLRGQGHDPDTVRAALEQVSLRYRLDHWWPKDWLLTRDGAEAASHPLVAQFHARVISEILTHSGIDRIVDLGAGIGSDSYALAAQGLAVTAWERDQRTAEFLEHNLRHFANATAIHGNSDLTESDSPAYFVDPARRSGTRTSDGNRALPERDPQRWTPPLSAVMARSRTAIAFMKAAPAFEPPRGWTRYCISVNRTLVEIFTSNTSPLNSDSKNFAVMIDTASQATVVIAEGQLPEGQLLERAAPKATELGDSVYEVDPAIYRAGLQQQVATEFGLNTIGNKGMWLTGNQLDHPPTYLRMYKVHAVSPIKDLEKMVAHLPGVAIKNKDSHLESAALRTASKKPDHNMWAVVVTNLNGHDVGILVSRESVTGEFEQLAW
jgi:hypothetical protein